MKRQLLFVHGGGEGAYEEDRKMAASLREALGGGYGVHCPKMPDEEDFASKLPEGLPMFFYHGSDDVWVPFEHLALYAEKVPQARVREFEGRGHQFDDDLSEVAHDIVSLERSGS